MKNVNKNYSNEAILNSKKHQNIYDLFDEISAKICLISSLKLDGGSLSDEGLFFYVEDIKDNIKGLELQLKRQIIEETLLR